MSRDRTIDPSAHEINDWITIVNLSSYDMSKKMSYRTKGAIKLGLVPGIPYTSGQQV